VDWELWKICTRMKQWRQAEWRDYRGKNIRSYVLIWSNGDRQEGDYGEEMLGRRHSCEAVAIGERKTVGEKSMYSTVWG